MRDDNNFGPNTSAKTPINTNDLYKKQKTTYQ